MIRKILPVLFIVFFAFSQQAFSQTKKLLSTIIIDPGHGGLDPGAKGTHSTEADVSLAVSLKLGDAIKENFPDTKIIFTRTTDVLPGNKPNKNEALRYRANLANSSGGDLFIAIHCNSAGRHAGGWYEKRVVGHETKYRMVKKGRKMVKKKYSEPIYETYWVENLVKGTETYIWALSKNDEKISSMTQNTNFYGEIDSTITMKLPDPKDPEDAARMLIYTQNFFRKSLSMADLVEKQFIEQGRTSRGVKQRNDKGIWVLQATGMPSILIEIGFISNKEEEDYLNSEEGQDEIVANIVTALKAYKQKLETKQQNGQLKAF
jgi:N-acetylmuramoyl-L-alanine amidase